MDNFLICFILDQTRFNALDETDPQDCISPIFHTELFTLFNVLHHKKVKTKHSQALSSEEGSAGSQDEVVSKLVTIINDLVENTDITMSDIVEMMKSSVNSTQDQNSSGLATCQSEAPQLMTSSQSQVTSSLCQGVDQKMPGILLPANWVQFNLNNVAAPHTNVSICARSVFKKILC